MTTKNTNNPLALPLDIKKSATPKNTANSDFVFDRVLFDTETLSNLQSVFNSLDSVGSKSASVKFMITMQDETELQKLGYSKAEIDKLKPQEAADILISGMNAEPSCEQGQ